jgi:cytochrome P450
VYSRRRKLVDLVSNKSTDVTLAGMVRMWYTTRLSEDPEYLRVAKHRIANDLFMFAFAAIANTFGAAAWVIFHVIRNTNGTGDRIRKELKTLADDSDEVPELESTLYEIARLYSPGSAMRLLLKPWELPSKGEMIPAGSVVVVPAFAAHRNPEGFANPLEFDPTRFGPDRDERKTAGSLYMAFGSGSHPCPGRKFAVLEVALFVSEALKAFDFSLVDDDERAEDPFTQSAINVPRHPRLNPKQIASIWRTTEPLLAHIERKSID